MKKSDRNTLIYAIKNHPDRTDEYLARLADCTIETVQKYRRIYGNRQSDNMHRSKAEKALTAYRKAVEEHVFRGAIPPEDHDVIDAELRDAENDLRDLLGAPRI